LRLRELQGALEETLFVGQAFKLGVFNQLYREPGTADELARSMGFDRRATWVMLEALVEMGYTSKKGEEYSVPDEIVSRLVEEGGDEYEGDFWKFLLYLVNPWRTLSHVLTHGEPDPTSYSELDMKDFIRGMDSPWKKKIAPEVVNVCLEYSPNATTVADIGGAPGTLAREFSRKNIHTIIYDLPESLEVMEKELSGITNVSLQKGDATVSLPEGPYDIAFLGNICHGQSPEDNQKIITMCHQNLDDNGIIAIFDNIRGESYLGATLALHMLTQSKRGNIYTRDEYIQWLDTAGFRDVEVRSLSDPAWQVIIAFK